MRQLLRRLKVALYGLRMRLAGASARSESGVRLHLDARDARAQSIHRAQGAHDQPAVELWKDIVNEVDATVLVDVGANYGEIGLSVSRPGTDLHLFEPNPRVAKYLRRSIAGNPDVVLHECAASDRTGVAALHLPRNRFGLRWSGVASLEAEGGPYVQVRTIRIDEAVSVTPEDRLAFKVDVEGHELATLAGMTGLLDRCEQWVGLCETDQPDAVAALGFRVIPTDAKDFILRPVSEVAKDNS